MENPWDIPSLPNAADENEDALYNGIGRVINNWEGVEVILSRIYSYFVGKAEDYETVLSYGSHKIFQYRFAELQKSAEQFFVSVHSQNLEGEFHELAARVLGFSGRRNDVAHGLVGPIQIYPWFQETAVKPIKPHTNYWAMFPAYYNARDWKSRGLPEYAYTSVELVRLAGHLASLYNDLTVFRNKLTYFAPRIGPRWS